MPRMMTMRWALLLAPLMVAGCSNGTMQVLGLQRDPPDEFQVTTQPALAMPPDLNAAAAALPAPIPGRAAAAGCRGAAAGRGRHARRCGP